MNKEVKEFKASHFDNMKELLHTIKVWLENEEDYGTLYDDFNRYFDSGAMEEMYYYIKQLEAKVNQLETNRDEAIEYIKHSWWLRTDQTYDTSKDLKGWEVEELLSLLERGKE